MKQLSNHEEFVLELHKEEVIRPHALNDTKGYGKLQFECGCGVSHGVNDYGIEFVATYFPVKFLFKCSSHYTKVHIKGFFKQKCLSLWTIRTDLIQDISADLKF